jgi:hypothetical protein
MHIFRRSTIAATLAVALGAPAHAATGDLHINYPPTPSGYAGLVKTFGQPCSADAQQNVTTWKASDDGQPYPIRYHAKLGGGSSTNLHDVIYHLYSQGYSGQIRSGIYAYACRKKRADSSEWSVHAWGVAFDIASRYEHFQHNHCHVLTSGFGSVWTSHRWKWGTAWSDCMHFQYASAY